jgi:hypothetical protein
METAIKNPELVQCKYCRHVEKMFLRRFLCIFMLVNIHQVDAEAFHECDNYVGKD